MLNETCFSVALLNLVQKQIKAQESLADKVLHKKYIYNIGLFGCEYRQQS